MKASYFKHILNFNQPSGTSRGILTFKETWFLKIEDEDNFGIGECSLLRGLSIDDKFDFEEKLNWVCENINLDLNHLLDKLLDFPAIKFGLETAFLDFRSDNPFILYPSDFTQGEVSIPINGLIWMGNKSFMKEQIKTKIKLGFSCIKIKIGAIDFQTEFNLIKYLRNEYSANDIEIRVDANGGFSPKDSLEKLKQLSKLDIHSVEQPIAPGQYEQMAQLCEKSPIPIALDEELIGINDVTKRLNLLQIINPKYIILKPSLLGGFVSTQSWINLAKKQSVGWWITSALESNIGLNAIAQWTYALGISRPQGLGTGKLFSNNIDSPLEINNGRLFYLPSKQWKLNL